MLGVILLAPNSSAQHAKDLSGVAITPPSSSWFVRVFPDGSVRATFGSLAQHQILMGPGSLDFGKLVDNTKNHLADLKITEGTQVSLLRLGESSHSSSYLKDDLFLRALLSSDPNAWRSDTPKLTNDVKPDGLTVQPISEEMRRILEKNPIFPKKTAEQAGTGKPATRPESKSEDGQKPHPESECRSR